MTKAAIQGIRGSYSEEAASKYFGDDVEITECVSFDEAFGSVRAGLADFAVIPQRNSIIGDIRSTVKLLETCGMRRIDEIDIEIEHVLAGTPGSSIENITSVYSHIEALRQCSAFFASNPHLSQVPGSDTASSVRSVVMDRLQLCAAICSKRAADIYGARILNQHVANATDNRTTFAIIGN